MHLLRSIALVLCAGCLSVPQAQQLQCTSDSDCETAVGEVCQSGYCWGGPPAGSFAAVAVPPSDRTDLISVEIPSLAIPTNGWLGNVPLGTPVTISGRVEAFCPASATPCSGNSIAAKVTVTRPSLFDPDPSAGFQIAVTSKDGVPRGSDSFSVAVPRTNPGDPPYVLTIVPAGNGDLPPANGTSSAAETAPPGRMMLSASDDTDTGTIMLGSDSSPILNGTLTDGAHLLSKYRVVALGHFDATSAPVEISPVDYVTNGEYSLTLADGAIGPIAIEARPYDDNVVAPTLTLSGLDPTTSQHTIAQPAYIGNKVVVTIPLEGLSGDGEVTPVSGARVTVTGTYVPPLGSSGAHAVLSAEVTTGDDGMATLTLLDGMSLASTYVLRVIPPASSTLGVIYDQPVALDAPMPVRLPPRIEIKGTVIDGSGNAMANISVTATPSLRFIWSVDAPTQEFLRTEIPAATTVTPAGGDFVVWVDPYVGKGWGRYDLVFAAPSGVDVASWTVPDVEVPRTNQPVLDLGGITVPDTAFIHGEITDPGMTPVGGGELRIFQLITDTSICGLVEFPPPTCVIPAQQLGRGTSDDQGRVKLALPR